MNPASFAVIPQHRDIKELMGSLTMYVKDTQKFVRSVAIKQHIILHGRAAENSLCAMVATKL